MTSACEKDVKTASRGRGRGPATKCPLFHKLKSGHPKSVNLRVTVTYHALYMYRVTTYPPVNTSYHSTFPPLLYTETHKHFHRHPHTHTHTQEQTYPHTHTHPCRGACRSC